MRKEKHKMQITEPLDAVCFHGGQSFEVIGTDFTHLERIRDVINADVLDAWFSPSPKVIDRLGAYLHWIVRTSPPTDCEGLVESISRHRDVPEDSVLAGAGSSNLIFLALREWLDPSSRVLLLNPTYGEYAHVCEAVIGCRVERFQLSPEDGFVVNTCTLAREIAKGYDLVVLVNPNNPTGRHIPRMELERLVGDAPATTNFWIDETYVDYVGPYASLERFAAGSPNVVVCKSMSKAYALSGLRVGYLCGNPGTIGGLRRVTPPWAVSLPGQIAAVAALGDLKYYEERHIDTNVLREGLCSALGSMGIDEVIPGVANFLMFFLPDNSPPRTAVFERCQRQGLFLRDPSVSAPELGSRAVRIAVKDAETNRRMVDILESILA